MSVIAPVKGQYYGDIAKKIFEGEKVLGSGGIRTHAIEMTGALNQRLRPLGHATNWFCSANKTIFIGPVSWLFHADEPCCSLAVSVEECFYTQRELRWVDSNALPPCYDDFCVDRATRQEEGRGVNMNMRLVVKSWRCFKGLYPEVRPSQLADKQAPTQRCLFVLFRQIEYLIFTE